MTYANLTVNQLKNLLRERGIRGYSDKKKTELVAMLEQHENAVIPRIPPILLTEIQMLIDRPEKIRRRYWTDMQTIIRNAFADLSLSEALNFMKEELGVDLIEDYNQKKESIPYTQSKQIADIYMNLLETNANDFEELSRLSQHHPAEEIRDPSTQKMTRDKFDRVSHPLVIRFLRDKMQWALPLEATRQQLADIFITELQRRADIR